MKNACNKTHSCFFSSIILLPLLVLSGCTTQETEATQSEFPQAGAWSSHYSEAPHIIYTEAGGLILWAEEEDAQMVLKSLRSTGQDLDSLVVRKGGYQTSQCVSWGENHFCSFRHWGKLQYPGKSFATAPYHRPPAQLAFWWWPPRGAWRCFWPRESCNRNVVASISAGTTGWPGRRACPHPPWESRSHELEGRYQVYRA